MQVGVWINTGQACADSDTVGMLHFMLESRAVSEITHLFPVHYSPCSELA